MKFLQMCVLYQVSCVIWVMVLIKRLTLVLQIMFPTHPSKKETGKGSTSYHCPNCGNSFSSRSSYGTHNCRASSGHNKLFKQCHKNSIFTDSSQHSFAASSTYTCWFWETLLRNNITIVILPFLYNKRCFKPPWVSFLLTIL